MQLDGCLKAISFDMRLSYERSEPFVCMRLCTCECTGERTLSLCSPVVLLCLSNDVSTNPLVSREWLGLAKAPGRYSN